MEYRIKTSFIQYERKRDKCACSLEIETVVERFQYSFNRAKLPLVDRRACILPVYNGIFSPCFWGAYNTDTMHRQFDVHCWTVPAVQMSSACKREVGFIMWQMIRAYLLEMNWLHPMRRTLALAGSLVWNSCNVQCIQVSSTQIHDHRRCCCCCRSNNTSCLRLLLYISYLFAFS